jgi:hypothetical protein
MLSASTLTVLRRVSLFVLVAVLGALAGAAVSLYPTVRDDLIFLHQSRLLAEYQALVQAQQQKNNSNIVVASPGTIAPTKPVESPPAKEK